MKFDAKNRLIRILRLITFFGFAWICVNHSAYAQAICKFTQLSHVSNTRFTFGDIVIPRDVPDGAPIATIVFNLAYDCPINPPAYPLNIGGFSIKYDGALALATQFPGVGQFNTAYEGLYKYTGLRMTNMDTGQVMNPLGFTTTEWGTTITGANPVSGMIRMKIELIKLSDGIYKITQMPNDSRPPVFVVRLANRNIDDPAAHNRMVVTHQISGTLKPMQQSCTVTNSSPEVRLPPVGASKLNLAGATAGDTGFNIGLTCRAGSNVYVTLTDLTAPGNTSDLLTLTQDSTAKGVKLRVSQNGRPVRYGPDSRVPGNLNQWYVGPSASTSNIPLSVQYVADGPVSGGTVKGVATFTMSYQ
ncbi:fimbrial protein [Burkholderia pyrrocinia]|uniref:Fimbrial protein n=1 Tax=Burkholderia pyrrocinia TaxID=60550 RepID=A0A2Z5MWQ2_BURPY|nr:fimbrial protein [Burkholderia pyrrocinia]AXF21793.1 fimbrial protein [Burkholderia pyrrocinia]